MGFSPDLQMRALAFPMRPPTLTIILSSHWIVKPKPTGGPNARPLEEEEERTRSRGPSLSTWQFVGVRKLAPGEGHHSRDNRNVDRIWIDANPAEQVLTYQ